MQLEAIYKDGRLEFLAPVRFHSPQFRVQVEVPDHEIVRTTEGIRNPSDVFQAYGLSAEALAIAQSIRKRTLDRLADTPISEEPMDLTPKQSQYWDAFEWRSRLREKEEQLP